MITPQLKSFIDSINNRYRMLYFKFPDGGKAKLDISPTRISLVSDNSDLIDTVGKLLEGIMTAAPVDKPEE